MAIDSTSYRDLAALGYGDPASVISLGQQQSGQVADAVPNAATNFSLALQKLLQRAQGLGTAGLQGAQLSGVDEQARRLQQTSPDLIGASPGIQSATRGAAVSAVQPTIAGAGNLQQTFTEQLGSVKEGITVAQDFFDRIERGKKEQRQEAFKLVANFPEVVKKLDDAQKRELEKQAGLEKGWIDLMPDPTEQALALKGRELELGRQSELEMEKQLRSAGLGQYAPPKASGGGGGGNVIEQLGTGILTQLEASKGTDRKADPEIYRQLRDDAAFKGISQEDFDEAFGSTLSPQERKRLGVSVVAKDKKENAKALPARAFKTTLTEMESLGIKLGLVKRENGKLKPVSGPGQRIRSFSQQVQGAAGYETSVTAFERARKSAIVPIARVVFGEVGPINKELEKQALQVTPNLNMTGQEFIDSLNSLNTKLDIFTEENGDEIATEEFENQSIRVRRKSDGKTGTLTDESEFDPNVYDKL